MKILLPDKKAGHPYLEVVEVPGDKPSVECFFCSGRLPCREHKPRDFADVDFQEYVMGEIDGKELFERQGVEYSD